MRFEDFLSMNFYYYEKSRRVSSIGVYSRVWSRVHWKVSYWSTHKYHLKPLVPVRSSHVILKEYNLELKWKVLRKCTLFPLGFLGLSTSLTIVSWTFLLYPNITFFVLWSFYSCLCKIKVSRIWTSRTWVDICGPLPKLYLTTYGILSSLHTPESLLKYSVITTPSPSWSFLSLPERRHIFRFADSREGQNRTTSIEDK